MSRQNEHLQCLEKICQSFLDIHNKVLAAEDVKANSIFEEVQGTLSTHQGEMAHFARDLRQSFNVSMEHSKNTSEFTNGFLQKLMEESGKLQSHVTSMDDIQTRSIVEFQKAYEEQSKIRCREAYC